MSDFETPAIAATRTADKQVATGTPSIDSISSFGPQAPRAPGPAVDHVHGHHRAETHLDLGHDTSTPEYAITIVSTATGWQVKTIQLAALGNQ